MTFEAKADIIKYLTGDLGNQNYQITINWDNYKNNTTNLYSDIKTGLGNIDYTPIEIIQGKDNKGNLLPLSVMYGHYDNPNAPMHSSSDCGFIAIIDGKGTLIQLITEYSSGTLLRKIYRMNVDENGNFFAIIDKVNTSTNEVYRQFEMYNNFLIKRQNEENYTLKLRKAYRIQSQNLNSSSLTVYKITKAVGQARYLVSYTMQIESGGIPYLAPCATEIVVNVGATNEWNDYTSSVWNDDSVTILDSYANWVGDSINFIILGIPYSYNKKLIKYTNSGQNVVITEMTFSIPNYDVHWLNEGIILNDTKGYFSFSYKYENVTDRGRCSLFDIDFTNNTINERAQFGFNYSQDIIERLNGFILKQVENELVFVCTVNRIIDNVQKNKIYVGRVRKDIYSYDEVDFDSSDVFEFLTPIENTFYDFNVTKTFNLYEWSILYGDTSYTCSQIYNNNNYNGSSVVNNKSLLPNSVILYNENNEAIFARNLYNKVIIGNTTTSTLEVPNLFLNEVPIEKENLLSYNNNIIITNEEQIITNLYETLNINFINSISIIDRNDPNNSRYMENGTNRLNNSINNVVDYTNAKATKIRLNYSDNTNYIKEINPATYITSFEKQYKFTIYIPLNKDVVSVDLISNDETTTYLTIDTSNLTRGKTYEISQDVEI